MKASLSVFALPEDIWELKRTLEQLKEANMAN